MDQCELRRFGRNQGICGANAFRTKFEICSPLGTDGDGPLFGFMVHRRNGPTPPQDDKN